MILSNKYRVAKLGSHCLCLTTSDLKTAIIEPVSDESLTNKAHHADKVQAVQTQTEKALRNTKQAQAVKPEITQTPQTQEEINRALWAEQTPGSGFFWLSVLFVFILIAAPALGH